MAGHGKGIVDTIDLSGHIHAVHGQALQLPAFIRNNGHSNFLALGGCFLVRKGFAVAGLLHSDSTGNSFTRTQHGQLIPDVCSAQKTCAGTGRRKNLAIDAQTNTVGITKAALDHQVVLGVLRKDSTGRCSRTAIGLRNHYIKDIFIIHTNAAAHAAHALTQFIAGQRDNCLEVLSKYIGGEHSKHHADYQEHRYDSFTHMVLPFFLRFWLVRSIQLIRKSLLLDLSAFPTSHPPGPKPRKDENGSPVYPPARFQQTGGHPPRTTRPIPLNTGFPVTDSWFFTPFHARAFRHRDGRQTIFFIVPSTGFRLITG